MGEGVGLLVVISGRYFALCLVIWDLFDNYLVHSGWSDFCTVALAVSELLDCFPFKQE
jgi:hypothetical protein